MLGKLGSDVNVYSDPWVKFLSWFDPGGMIYESAAKKVVYGNTFQSPSAPSLSIPAPQTQTQMTQTGAWTPDNALSQYGVDWKQSIAGSMSDTVIADDTNWLLYLGIAGAAILGLVLLNRN